MNEHIAVPEIIRRYLEAYNNRDVSALADCVAERVVFENVSNRSAPMLIEGREAFVQLATQAVEMFTERRQTVRMAVVGKDRVALDVDWTGTPAADLGEMKAGESVSLRGASFFTIADGRIVRIVDLS